jgi:multiple sugar transport system substrate-binding protein
MNLAGTRAEAGIQKFADLINVYHVSPDPAEMATLPGGTVALLTNQVAMTLDGSWCIMDLSDNDVDFGIGVMPKMYDVPATNTLGEPIVIFASCEHPEEAYKLVKMFMQPEHSMGLIAGGLWKPVLRDWLVNDDLVSQWAGPNDIYPPEFRTALLRNTFENGVPTRTYTIRNLPRINDILNPVMDTVWVGDRSAADAIASVQAQVDAEVQGLFPRP